MKLFQNLQARILSVILTTVLLIILAIGIFVGVRNHNFAVDKAYEYTQLMAEKNAYQMDASFLELRGLITADAEHIASQLKTHGLTANQISELLKIQMDKHPQFQAVWLIVDAEQINADATLGQWTEFELGHESNKQIKSKTADKSDSYFSLRTSANSGFNIFEPFSKNGQLYSEMAMPVMVNGKVQAYVGALLNLDFVHEFVKNSEIFEGGFITVMTPASQFIGHVNKAFLGKKFKDNFTDVDYSFHVEQQVSKGKSFEILTKFQHRSYYSYFVPFDIDDSSNNWMVEVTVPMDKILEASKKSIRNSVLVALLGMVIMIIVIWQVTKRVIGPVRKVTNVLDLLATGNTQSIEFIELNSSGELQQMSESLNKVVDGLKKSEHFALEIGKGNLQADFQVLGDDDQLGKALLLMRQSLQHSADEEKKRKKDEEIRSWATQGVAKFGEILRQDSHNMKKLGYNFVTNLVNYLDVNQGAMFVINDELEDDPFFELITAVAYGRDKFMQKQIKAGEGLVGRCAFEKKTIFLTEVPGDYVNITSGLGTSNPTCVLIVPCVLNNEVFGIIELASFRVLQAHEIEFVEKLGESVASTISSVKVNEKTNRLLSASQNQGEELAAQEEELRQNLEEMEATQEDLKRQMENNAKMREEMLKQTALLDALLNSLPDYIYFKDSESRFLRISKSMLGLFGATSVDEVIGKSDFDFQTPENAQKYYDDEMQIIQTRKGITNQLQRELLSNGTVIWTSVTKLPLMTEEGECMGTFGISKDVTELKSLEIESNGFLNAVKNAMYTVEYDTEGKVIDVNDGVLKLLGIKREDYIGTSHCDGAAMKNVKDAEYKAFWDKLREGKVIKHTIKLTINKKETLLSEIYSPVVNEVGDVLKVLQIAFDITELINQKK